VFVDFRNNQILYAHISRMPFFIAFFSKPESFWVVPRESSKLSFWEQHKSWNGWWCFEFTNSSKNNPCVWTKCICTICALQVSDVTRVLSTYTLHSCYKFVVYIFFLYYFVLYLWFDPNRAAVLQCCCCIPFAPPTPILNLQSNTKITGSAFYL